MTNTVDPHFLQLVVFQGNESLSNDFVFCSVELPSDKHALIFHFHFH